MSQELPEEVLREIALGPDGGEKIVDFYVRLAQLAHAAGRASMKEEAAKEPSTGDILLAAGELSKDTLRAVKAVSFLWTTGIAVASYVPVMFLIPNSLGWQRWLAWSLGWMAGVIVMWLVLP